VNFEVALNGGAWTVGIEPGDQPGRFVVTVNGRARTFDAAWIDNDTVSLIEGSTVREARIDARGDAVVAVLVGSRRFEVSASQDRRRRPRAHLDTPAGARRASVKSPMPGRVVRVLVSVGDRVSAGQPLIVIEAMKMENELRAPFDGVVGRVGVEAGAPVDADTVLVVIE
jgi:biotin carboxyl carrier protein